MKWFSFLKRVGVDLYYFYFKGARIDAALQWQGRMQGVISTYPRKGAVPSRYIGDQPEYGAEDIERIWEVSDNAILIIKNNSKHYAYNVTFPNHKDIFTRFELPPKLTSIAPDARIEIPVTIIHYNVSPLAEEVRTTPDLPANKQDRYLLIQYENERGTHFLTRFITSFKTIRNEYTFGAAGDSH
ncbi:hypothetical protein [Dinghuibacter silviterrae]|uniref:Uncharacterized protein n=1 Tax=Dinghuibacter silviterrae TaxID=1539049 RepID=A0A4R8DHD6_9BACT|nr:hypothetical protein [Dinghuibacter silviterrae]TDW97131.1 hypothetical protein EDB95_4972 [Dinghuibacter silviterrae]